MGTSYRASCAHFLSSGVGRRGGFAFAIGISVLLLVLAGCDSGGSSEQTGPLDQASCDIPRSQFADGGVGKDGIPALTDPPLVDADEATYLADTDRVIGLIVDGQAYAVPHNILWWHEIVNLNFESVRLAVTYCPLTGSSLAFDRTVIDGGEFGVSGLLLNNNLTMYDRTNQESLWPQMNRMAECGPRTGAALTMVPVIEMTWGGWQALHPDTKVISDDTGFARTYTTNGYPYGDYEERDNDRLLFPAAIDGRRPPKERVLGIPEGEGGVAYPFGALDDDAPVTVVHDEVGGESVVVFWSQAKRGAMAFRPMINGQAATFEERGGQIVDTETGSVWNVNGTAVDGPQQGARLEPISRAYVAFWFAWALFQTETSIYTP